MPLRDEIDIDSVVFKTLLIDTITEDPSLKKQYKYTGEVNTDNLPDGYGIGVFTTFKYCGLWSNGIQNGEGIKYCSQSNNTYNIKYIGMFRGPSIQGKGTIYVNNNLYYSGNFVNNKYEGYGEIYENTGKTRFKGNFKLGLREGKGFLYDNDNLVYEGYFKNDKRSGIGKSYDTKHCKVNPKYSGEWDNDMYNGKGLLYYAQCNYYSGMFVNNKREGYGKSYANNETYDGYFKNDKRNGKGVLTVFISKKCNRILKTYEAEFKDDILTGYGKCSYKNGDTYEGNYVNAKKEGFGIYFCYKTNTKYEGNWKDDLKDGNILITDDNGNTYKSIWKNGKQTNKKRYEKEYVDDELPIKKVRKEIPVEYKCPISLSIMMNPVIASDGNTYELSSLEDLFKKFEDATSPLTREKLDKSVLIPNKNIKKLIQDMLADDPLVLHM